MKAGQKTRSPVPQTRKVLPAVVAVAGLLGIAAVGLSALPFASARVPTNPPAPRYYGVNLASGSFASNKMPGRHGKDYIYPTRKIAEPFRQMGMNTVRLPILWGRIQREPFAPFDQGEIKLVDQTIAQLSGFRTIILDVHNYGRYGGEALDKTDRGPAMLADLWTKLAQRYKDNPRVAFGIMNEPHDMDAAQWRRISDQAVDAIRRTGARNLVLVPGVRWTGGHSWNKGGNSSNAVTLSGFMDPGHNFMFEVHQYLDSDSSGTKKDCVPGAGRQRLVGVTRWLREERAQAILAEFGVPPTPTCLTELDSMLSYLRENGDVWAGWTYWAGGDWWGKYPFNIQPAKDGTPKPQAEVLQRQIASYRQAS